MPSTLYQQSPAAAWHRSFRITAIAVFATGLVQAAFAQDFNAEPLYGAVELSAGFTPDPQLVELLAGGTDSVGHLGNDCVGFIAADQPDYKLTYEAASSQLGIFVDAQIDTTLVINGPRGNWHCNDDASNLSDTNPGILFNTPLSGNYNIWVGTYSEAAVDNTATLAITEWDEARWSTLDMNKNGSADPGTLASTGGIDFGDNISNWANNGECDDPRFEGQGMAAFLIDSDIFHDANDCAALFNEDSIRLLGADQLILSSRLERGSLSGGDSMRPNDSYLDSYRFIASRGDSAVVDLRSGEFDTYLIVRSPSGEEFVNDDYESSYDRSLLSLSLDETGTYEVLVSSYEAGETGGYTVEIETDAATAESINQQIGGTLTVGDNNYTAGEYVDSYTFEGRPGQSVTIDLQSDEFDTFLILRSPNGEQEFNDDFNSTSRSLIETQLSDSGTYEVLVTSYAVNETGTYSLQISDMGTSSYETVASRDVINLNIGESIQGTLEQGDSLSDENEFQDSYIFTANAGDAVTIDLTSTAFDTYLSLLTPSGESIENDDYQNSTDQSLLQLTLQESGRFRVITSSYASNETGNYRLSLRRSASLEVESTTISSSNGQIYGIFAGIADYPGSENDLSLTDQDARRARDALIEGAGMNPDNAYTLIDSDATRENFQRALDAIDSSINQDDTLVIFYSGHGNRVPRPAGPNSSDPDGMDETMELYDGALLDDELSDMLDGLNAGTVLLVMDSCFSGGFAKDIISAPGRMGLFSSEEDVTSQVAFKFQAGGYLSVFFDEAVRGGYADRDENGELTAIELSQYLHDRFRDDVKSMGETDYVRTSGPQSAYQHLVVDRGGVGPYSVLFRHD